MTTSLKTSKNQLRRAKRKAAKAENSAVSAPSDKAIQQDDEAAPEQGTKSGSIEALHFDDDEDPLFELYRSVITRFKDEEEATRNAPIAKPEIFYDDDDEIPDEDDGSDSRPRLSKKKRKELNKLSVAELKALVVKPEIVDWTDTSATDPRLLVHIKASRNVIPVPVHWSLKREYLSSKRGVEKPPFALPKFIADTGIAEMRDAVLEKQDQASLKQKQRERVQPKMGKLDIDYQKLYEAFFRFQTKPELTRYGEIYYEGKEYETDLRYLRPGDLSEDLKEALNIPPGAPPPWLINQQRFGPPPSYPALKIPGLNAPPPPGGSWGFHPGGYGKPPVDEFNRPLYGGDIFGVLQPQPNAQTGEPIEKQPWGELAEPEEASEDEEESDEESDAESTEDPAANLDTSGGLETPAGIHSTIPPEIGDHEILNHLDLRKQRPGTETEVSGHHASAYQVVSEQKSSVEGFFGGDKRYDIKTATAAATMLPVLGQEDQMKKRKKPGDVDVSIDPETLESNSSAGKNEVQELYEAGRKAESGKWGMEEDLSDMIAVESRKRQKRDEEKRKR